jgi:hypothetical protein
MEKKLNKHELFVFLLDEIMTTILKGCDWWPCKIYGVCGRKNRKIETSIVDVAFMERHFMDYKVNECILTGLMWLNR